MRALRDIPIKRKLVVVIMFASTVSVLIGVISLLSYELVRDRRTLVRNFSALAEILGANSAVTVASHDRVAAGAALSALQARPDILYACLYTADGTMLAEYNPNNLAAAPQWQPNGERLEGGHLFVFRPVKLRGDTVGSICLSVDLHRERPRLIGYVAIALVILLGALFATLLLSTRLQGVVADPILALEQVARSISEREDYSLRAEKYGHDEIGALAEAFNQMLEQVQKRDHDLRTSLLVLDWHQHWEGRMSTIGTSHQWVFYNPAHPERRAISFKRSFENARKRAGIPHFRPYDLRH